MQIISETMNEPKNLTQDERNDFAVKLAEKFKKWDEDRDPQITTARKIMKEVYLNQSPRARKDWQSDIKLNSIYNIKEAKKAQLWSVMWSHTEQMFGVRGTDEQTEQQAKIQKAALVYSLEQMEVQKQYDIVADDYFDTGEMIFKTDWERREKIVKRQKKDIGFVFRNILKKMNGSGFMTASDLTDVKIPYYENARVEAVSPFMFVFDHTKFKKGNKAAWDSLVKIYKRFDTLENIKANKVYTLTPEMLSELDNENSVTKSDEKKDDIDLRDKDFYGGQYSVLYAHGDFKIEGKVYKNYIAEVLAGKYLIRFEENPLFINPFIFCAVKIDPETKRGISPLKASLSLAKTAEDLVNVASDTQKLTANPPQLSPEGLFDEKNTEKDGNIELEPGKIIEYTDIMEGKQPTPIQVSASGIDSLLNLFDQKLSDTSNVSNFMYGNVTDTKRTATELSLVDKGASAQTSKEIDIINQDLTIPMIKNVAELLAMFKSNDDYIYTQEKGKNVEYRITQQIREAEYSYIYEDRNALENRKAKLQQLYEVFTGAYQIPELAKDINWDEVFITYLEGLGWDDTDKFFKHDNPVDIFAEQLKQIPDEYQEQVVGLFAQQLQQMINQYQQQQQENEMRQRAAQQVEMQNYRDEARAANNINNGLNNGAEYAQEDLGV